MDLFGDMKGDILKDTFDLLDDLKSGRPLDIDKCFDKFFSRSHDTRSHDDFFSSDFGTGARMRDKRNRSDVGRAHRMSFPNVSSSSQRTTTETDYEPVSNGNRYSKTKVKRSESTYSTSSYDTSTTDSNDTRSEVSDSSFSPTYGTYGRGRHNAYLHNRSSSSDSSRAGDVLNKKYEDEFLNDERHSMPHEIYSKCHKYLNDLDVDRPRSTPPEPNYVNLSNNWRDSNTKSKFYPSKFDSGDSPFYKSGSSIISGGHNYSRQASRSSDLDNISDSRSTVTASENRLHSMSSFEFPSLSDVRSETGSNIPSPPYSPPATSSTVRHVIPVVREITQKTSESPVAKERSSNPPVFPERRECKSMSPVSSSSHLDRAALSQKLRDENKSWEERHDRMEDALKWLTTELVS